MDQPEGHLVKVQGLVADWDKSRERRDILTIADKMALEGRILSLVYEVERATPATTEDKHDD